MAKLRLNTEGVSFRCPGCGDTHHVPTSGGHAWQFNGDAEKPTLSPSILVRSGHHAPHWKPGDNCWCGKDYGFTCYLCHSFVRNGRIEFCADSTHALAGQTVDLADIVEDQHVMPTTGREHLAAVDCWCSPRVDDGVPSSSGARVWIHSEREPCCPVCGEAHERERCQLGIEVD